MSERYDDAEYVPSGTVYLTGEAMPANPDHSADEPTYSATLKLHLRADSGYESDERHRIDANQWERICAILNEPSARPEAQAAPKLTEEQIENARETLKSGMSNLWTAGAMRSATHARINALCDMALASLHAQAGVSGDAAAEAVMVPRKLLDDALEFAEQYEGVIAGVSGPRPNQAMYLAHELRQFLAVTEPGHE